MEITLYHHPGACSRVTMAALEQTGAAYDAVLVNLMTGEQKGEAYTSFNPRGKVPALLVDGRLLTENAAIQLWLNATFPEAGLLPPAHDDWTRAQQHSDLIWISATVHPYVRANMMPIRWTVGDEAPVRERGKLLLAPCMDIVEARVAAQDWWYDTGWSIIDVYLYWCYTTAEKGQFDLSPFSAIAAHRARVEGLPCLQRAIAKETEARRAHGLPL